MAITTLTPGVYIEEISTLPPSVAPVATAIPAFIGYTKNHSTTGTTPVRITSLPEFVSIFGGAKAESIAFTVADTTTSRTITFTAPTSVPAYNLFYSLQLYFANGGGPCWIASVGSLTDAIDDADFEAGLLEIEKIDEPTLLLFPDAISLPFNTGKPAEYGSFLAKALAQCNKLQDRFVISDLPTDGTNDYTHYRDVIGTGNLKYGAAYTPYLKTVFNFQLNESTSTVSSYTGSLSPSPAGTSLERLNAPFWPIGSNTANTIFYPDLYRQLVARFNENTVTLPPSGAIAGIYASVDRDRGVWKAPANISVNAISAPVTIITNSEQELLNVDATSGKSINAIRPFTGKGTLVWGARTLAGNDNEWRYVNVRRLFIYAEESIKKATEFVVFEPNDKNTWDRVKGLISNFLTNLWRDGGLVGPTPEQAFFVKVGLGETMTPQDILDGKLIVQVGMAASRPAEFIILQFSHKLQEA